MLPEGYSGPIPQSYFAQQQTVNNQPKINSIGKFLGHGMADMAMPPANLPQAPHDMMAAAMQGNQSLDMAALSPVNPMGSVIPNMAPMQMPNMPPMQNVAPMTMPPMQNMAPMSMPSSGYLGMQPQQSVNLNEASLQQTPNNAQNFAQALAMQQGGSRNKRVLHLKKDFFF